MRLGENLPKVLASPTQLLLSRMPPQHSKHIEKKKLSFAWTLLSNVIVSIFVFFFPLWTEGNSQHLSSLLQLCEDYFLFLLQIIWGFYDKKKTLLHHCDLLCVEWQQIVFTKLVPSRALVRDFRFLTRKAHWLDLTVKDVHISRQLQTRLIDHLFVSCKVWLGSVIDTRCTLGATLKGLHCKACSTDGGPC